MACRLALPLEAEDRCNRCWSWCGEQTGVVGVIRLLAAIIALTLTSVKAQYDKSCLSLVISSAYGGATDREILREVDRYTRALRISARSVQIPCVPAVHTVVQSPKTLATTGILPCRPGHWTKFWTQGGYGGDFCGCVLRI